MPTPLGNRVLVEQFDEAPKSATGLVMPDEAKDAFKVAKGRVVGVGPQVARDLRLTKEEIDRVGPGSILVGEGSPMVSVGETVYFNKFSGERIKASDGKEYLVLKDSELLAKD